MPAPTVKIRFDPSLDKLRDMYGAVQIDAWLKKMVVQLSFEIERESKKVTPVDTGRLRSSIVTEIGGAGLKATVGPDVYYDIFVHEGTRKMRARPFMTWGVEAATIGLDEKLTRDLNAYLDDMIQ